MTGRRIATIRGSAASHGRRQAIADTGQATAIVANRRVYYPYDWYLLRAQANTWFGTTSMDLSCLVDCRTRVAATTDRFQTETLTTADALVLDRRVQRDDTLPIARRYAAHAIRHKHKALVPPQIEVLRQQSVYKPFWVIDCRLENKRGHRMLIDAVTGEYCVLATDTRTADE